MCTLSLLLLSVALDPHSDTVWGLLYYCFITVVVWAVGWAVIYFLIWLYVKTKRRLQRTHPSNSI